MNKDLLSGIISTLFLVCGLVCMVTGLCMTCQCDGVTSETVRDTITYVDTIAYYQPVLRDSTVLRYVMRVLPVKGRDSLTTNKTDTFLAEKYAQNNGENIRIMRNSGCARQNSKEFGSALAGTEIPPQYASVGNDSAAVAIPITQKRYEGNDYRAYVSGYEPRLDSIFVYPKTSVVHERSYKPPNKWHIGITGGFGYGLRSNRAEPSIGIGITYSIFSF